jgi:hypothetical protein
MSPSAASSCDIGRFYSSGIDPGSIAVHADCSKPQATPFSEKLTSVFHAVLVAMLGWMTLGAFLHIAGRII